MRSGLSRFGAHSSRPLLIIGVAVGFALTGCNANPEPAPLPTEGVSSTATTTPTPSTSAPSMPVRAKGTSKAAAKAFVRHYIDLVNHAMATGDTRPLADVSHPECSSCQAVIQRVESVYSSGGHIVSDGWKIRSLTMVPLQPSHKPVIDVGLIFSPQKVVEDAGGTPKHFDGGRLPATFYLGHHKGEWAVLRWERAA